MSTSPPPLVHEPKSLVHQPKRTSPPLAAFDIVTAPRPHDAGRLGVHLGDDVELPASTSAITTWRARPRTIELLKAPTSGFANRERALLRGDDRGVDEDRRRRPWLFGTARKSERQKQGEDRGEEAHPPRMRLVRSLAKPFERRESSRLTCPRRRASPWTRPRSRPGRLDRPAFAY